MIITRFLKVSALVPCLSALLLILPLLSDSAPIETDFREDFDSDRLSIFQWGNTNIQAL